MRYEPEFLNECMRIKNMSTNAYKYLRFNGFLPLPSLSTLLRLSKMPKTTPAVEGCSNQMTVENVEMTEENRNTDETSSVTPESEESEFVETIMVDTGGADIEVSVSPEITVEILSAE